MVLLLALGRREGRQGDAGHRFFSQLSGLRGVACCGWGCVYRVHLQAITGGGAARRSPVNCLKSPVGNYPIPFWRDSGPGAQRPVCRRA